MPVFKRGKYFHYEFTINGQRFRGSTKKTTYTAAVSVEREKIAEAEATGPNSLPRRAQTLRELSVRFLDYLKKVDAAGSLAPGTHTYYKLGWRLLEAQPGISNMRIDRITPSDADVLLFPDGPANANKALRTLRRMLHLAEEWGMISRAPRIREREEFGRTAIITPKIEDLLLECAPQPLADVLVITKDSGMRPDEVLRMRWEYFQLELGVYMNPSGKTARARRPVGLSERMKEVIDRRRLSAGKSPWVFQGDSASGRRTTVTKQWQDTLKKARELAENRGLPPLPPGLVLYCARHTFASEMSQSGMNVMALRDLLGHASLATTQKYVHLETQNAAEIVNRRNCGRTRPRHISPGNSETHNFTHNQASRKGFS